MLRKSNTFAYFGPPGETHHWQAIDQGAGRAIKAEMGELQISWLDDDANLESWEKGMTASERRIMMTKWAAEAYEKLIKNDKAIERYFEKGGLLITSNGTNDEKITPENLKYSVPPPPANNSLLEDGIYGSFLACDRYIQIVP